MGTNYHNEALRKSRVIERTREASGSGRQPLITNEDATLLKTYGAECGGSPAADEYHLAAATFNSSHYVTRPELKAFRLHEDGFCNRYRSGTERLPHVDSIYQVMYPEKDNSAYVDNPCRTNRRVNLNSDRFDVLTKINGNTHVNLVSKKLHKQQKV